jgi:nitrite reductase (NADH) small subunit
MEVMAGGIPIALCNTGGEIRATGGICPHLGGPLGHGAVNGENIVCPWHGWEFSCFTGRNDFDPDTRIPTYPVRMDGDDILVDLSA